MIHKNTFRNTALCQHLYTRYIFVFTFLFLKCLCASLLVTLQVRYLYVCVFEEAGVCRCRCMCVSACVCSARLCSPAAAAPARDSGSACRELKPDVMQQESPSQQSQVPTAAREIMKRCGCVCVCIYIYRVCLCICLCALADTQQCFLHIRGSVQGLSAPHAERGIAFSCVISCWERNS